MRRICVWQEAAPNVLVYGVRCAHACLYPDKQGHVDIVLRRVIVMLGNITPLQALEATFQHVHDMEFKED